MEQRDVVAGLAIHHLGVRPDAARAVLQFAREHPDGLPGVLGELAQAAKTRGLTAVDAQLVSDLRQEDATMEDVGGRDLGQPVCVYDSFQDVPRWRAELAKGLVQQTRATNLLSGPQQRDEMYLERYSLLLLRLLRTRRDDGEPYVVLASESGPNRNRGLLSKSAEVDVLTPVETLMGNPGRKLTFGAVRQNGDTWVLEDRHASVELDLSACAPSPDFVTNGSFALAIGEVVDRKFKAEAISCPPAVERANCERGNYFGGDLTTAEVERMRQLPDPGGRYVCFSDVHLDQPHVQERLRTVMTAYEDDPPTMYVLMGNFASRPWNPARDDVLAAYTQGFEWLSKLLQALPNTMSSSRVLLVPGPGDPGREVLPRPPLTPQRTAFIASKCPNVTLASNPCRVRHYGKELIFLRKDVSRALHQHRVMPLQLCDPPLSSTEVEQEIARCIFNQAHVAPVPLSTHPVLVDLDHALRLYPLPTALCVGDASSTGFQVSYMGAQYVSCASFASRKAEFVVYDAAGGQDDQGAWEQSACADELVARRSVESQEI